MVCIEKERWQAGTEALTVNVEANVDTQAALADRK